MPLVALGLLVGATVPAAAAGPAAGSDSPGEAQAAKKKKKKKAKKKKKKKKKPAAPATPAPPRPPPPPPPPPQQTTFDKIDAAVAGGAITPEQGLTYKVFAGFGDPRLPAQFVGNAPDPLAQAPLNDVAARWAQLSAGTQATLGPFLIPPFHQGSYWDQQVNRSSLTPRQATARDADPSRPWCDPTTNNQILIQDWSFVEADSGKVRIWYQNRFPTDAAGANTLMTAMETTLWPSVANTLMAREPLPDGGSTESCSGGSDAVDISLVDGIAKATTYASGLAQEGTSAKMIFPRGGSGATTPFLAHEFMHMIQYSFVFSSGTMASGENAWLKEGTAQWVQDYASSIGLTPDQTEHQALQYFFPYPEKSLDSTTPNHHDYGSYLFWLWAVRKGNDPTLVRQVWNAVASQKSLNAAKSLFGGGWAQAWKDFTKANWNKDPIGDYQDWDDIHDTAKEAASGTLNNEFSAINVFVDPVAAKYLTFEPADDVSVLTYKNVGPLNDEHAVQAIITNEDGTKETEDWTQIAEEDVPFCNIKELTLVVSNASITAGDAYLFPLSFQPPEPDRRAAGRAGEVCLPDPQGSFSGTAHYTDNAVTEIDWNWSGNVQFEPDGQGSPWFPEFFDETWDVAVPKSGSITISGSGTVETDEDDCTIDVPSQTFTYTNTTHGGAMIIQPGPQPHYGIQISLPDNAMPQGTISCPDIDPQTTLFPVPAMVFTEEAQQAATRGTYTGSATFSNEFFNANMNWNLSEPEE